MEGRPHDRHRVRLAGKRNWLRDYEEKRREYLALGVAEYWVIDRFRRTMTVYRNPPRVPAEQVVAENEVYRTDLLPGFELPLAQILAVADDWKTRKEAEVSPGCFNRPVSDLRRRRPPMSAVAATPMTTQASSVPYPPDVRRGPRMAKTARRGRNPVHAGRSPRAATRSPVPAAMPRTAIAIIPPCNVIRGRGMSNPLDLVQPHAGGRAPRSPGGRCPSRACRGGCGRSYGRGGGPSGTGRRPGARSRGRRN